MEKTYNYVYRITNNINGDYYIGAHSTNDLDDGYMGSGYRLADAYSKYHIENFTKEILEFCDSEKAMYQREAELVTQKEVDDPHCYNLCVGGMGGDKMGAKTAEEKAEIYRKVAVANTGKLKGVNRLANKTEEELLELNAKKSQSLRECWANLTPEERKERGDALRAAWSKRPRKKPKEKVKAPPKTIEELIDIYDRISQSKKGKYPFASKTDEEKDIIYQKRAATMASKSEEEKQEFRDKCSKGMLGKNVGKTSFNKGKVRRLCDDGKYHYVDPDTGYYMSEEDRKKLDRERRKLYASRRKANKRQEKKAELLCKSI